MDPWTIGWLGWIGWFAVEEGLALFRGHHRKHLVRARVEVVRRPAGNTDPHGLAARPPVRACWPAWPG